MLLAVLLLSTGMSVQGAMSPSAPFCTDFTTPAFYSPGSSWTSDTRCERYECLANGTIQVQMCGSLQGCETTKPDLDQKFPQCCPGYACNPDPEAFYYKPHSY